MPSPSSELRREPRQQRSVELVERILDVTDSLLAAGNFESISTTRIAEEAGVSVGALYQYFPDREAIVNAVAVRHIEDSEELMAEAIERGGPELLSDPAGTFVELFAARYRAEPGYRAIWFGSRLTDALRETDRHGKEVLAEGVRTVLAAGGRIADPERLVPASRVAVTACDALLQEAFPPRSAGRSRHPRGGEGAAPRLRRSTQLRQPRAEVRQ